LEEMDSSVQSLAKDIPLLNVNAGPRDGAAWIERLKEEYMTLIKYVQLNKAAGDDWFELAANKEGTKWQGKCWYMYNYAKYELKVEFEIPATYPATAPDIILPELDGTRIITQTNSEFLQCVPKSTASIFAISSTEPGALLYEALDAFNNRSAKSYDLIRQIKEDLSHAVDDCIEAASNDCSIGIIFIY